MYASKENFYKILSLQPVQRSENTSKQTGIFQTADNLTLPRFQIKGKFV